MSKVKIFLIPVSILLALAAAVALLSPVIVKYIYIGRFGQENYDRFKNLQAGDYVTFGAYEQDRDADNGAEPIEWLVLSVEDHKAFLLSRYVLDRMPYSKVDGDVTWQTSYIRQWLNSEFLDGAFTQQQRGMIPQMQIVPDKGAEDGIDPGADTYDQVILLSLADVNQYFTSNEERQCQATGYAKLQGILAAVEDSTCWWWLRSAGNDLTAAAYVLVNGYAYGGGIEATKDFLGVRPAIWVELPMA